MSLSDFLALIAALVERCQITDAQGGAWRHPGLAWAQRHT